jgi:putative MATE family efflux protein
MMDFTKGSISRQAMAFGLPLLAGNLLQFMSFVINSIIVGRFLGSDMLAAVTCTMPVSFFLVSFLIGMGMATNVLSAQAYGAKQFGYIKRILPNAWMVSMAIGVVVSVFGITASNWILDLINVPDRICGPAQFYFRVICAGMVLQFTYNWFSGTLRGLGDSKTPLNILIVSTVLNVVLAPIFIIVFQMGIVGAALGSMTANGLSLVWGYLHTIKKYDLFNVRQWDFTLDREVIKKMLVIGVPGSLQMMVTSLSGIFIMSIVNRFGTDVTAAYGIGMQADQISFVPAMTLSMVISAMVGQNLGAGQYDRVRQIFRVVSAIAVAIGTVLCLFVFAFPSLIASLYTTNPVVLAHAPGYFRIVCFTYITFALMFSLQGVVRGAGATMVMLLFSVIALVGVRVPLIWYLSQHTALAERGIWLGLLLSTFVGVGLSWWYYRSGRWMHIKVLPVGPVPVVEEVESAG